MQPLTEVLFDEAFQAQQKYERCCTLYGTKSSTSMMPLFQYESLHSVIERAGLVTAYVTYYRERKKRSEIVCV